MADQRTFKLTVASVGETFFDGEAVSVSLPGAEGEMVVLANHEAIVTTLKPGNIVVHAAHGEAKTYPVLKGILEMSGNRAVVLL